MAKFTDVRAIEVPGSGPEHDEIFLALVGYLEETSDDPVFFQYSSFLPAKVFSNIIHRWRMAPTLLGAHGDAKCSVGRGWQRWIYEKDRLVGQGKEDGNGWKPEEMEVERDKGEEGVGR